MDPNEDVLRELRSIGRKFDALIQYTRGLGERLEAIENVQRVAHGMTVLSTDQKKWIERAKKAAANGAPDRRR